MSCTLEMSPNEHQPLPDWPTRHSCAWSVGCVDSDMVYCDMQPRHASMLGLHADRKYNARLMGVEPQSCGSLQGSIV